MNYDKLISNIFFKHNKFSTSKLNKLYCYPNIQSYLTNRYDDYSNLKETIYRIHFNIITVPKCLNCGKSLSITYKPKKLYRDFCSYFCSNSYNDKKKKYESTCLQKYGKKTTWQLNKSRTKACETFRTKESKSKRLSTLKHNHTFNTSKSEDESYAILKEYYPDVVSQYKDARYPFACDFYIPSLDLFIECNYHWTHGGKPYEGTDDDRQIVEKWKAKGTKFYINAINTWTIRDVNKLNIAKQNKLKIKIFYNIFDFKTCINKMKK